jgi:flagellar biosynthetic protein FliP
MDLRQATAKMARRWSHYVKAEMALAGVALLLSGCSMATNGDGSTFTLQVTAGRGSQPLTSEVQLFLLLTILALAPAILTLMTAFVRIVVVLSILRSALGVPQLPPNQIIIGLALFLTFFIMQPVWDQINQQALQPLMAGEIDQNEAARLAMEPARAFMLRQVREEDLALFIHMAQLPRPRNEADVPTFVLVPAFVISELKTAFQMAFVIYIPFLVIDLVVSSALMAMGMMMLPPMLISLPCKLLLFVMVDGWHLIARSLVLSFAR